MSNRQRKANRARSKMPVKKVKQTRNTPPRLKTRMGMEAAGRLLLNNPRGMYRGEIMSALGLKNGAWQSISKHPMFKKHPSASPTAKRVRWVVDEALFEESYGNPEPMEIVDPVEDTTDDKLQRFYEANAPKDTNIVDFFVGSPPFSPVETTTDGSTVSIVINGTTIDMNVKGEVSFTIRG